MTENYVPLDGKRLQKEKDTLLRKHKLSKGMKNSIKRPAEF